MPWAARCTSRNGLAPRWRCGRFRATGRRPPSRAGIGPGGAASGLAALLDGFLLRLLGPLDGAAGREALVAEHPQGFHFGALAAAAAVLQHLHVARAGLSVFVGRAFFFRLGTPEDQELADVLDRRGAELVGQLLVDGVAGFAV